MTKDIKTLGQLKKSGYAFRSIKDELRDNLIQALQSGTNVFEGIVGFDDTVIPDLHRAILSRHNILLLGLRGQAKTRIARLMVHLLDEYIPVIAGSELMEDPVSPLTYYGRQMILEHGDQTPIEWKHRSERYVEKLATPDVSIADLIGDVDPIKAATLKLPYNDERVIHYGLIPRSHRSIFVINEIPDLQARIQVSLFNILQEGDMQIRGFKMRFPLDIQFVFTANPEDYTNRGSIITPLKDRIESQILTHYPTSIDLAMQITSLENRIHPDQSKSVEVLDLHRKMIEMININARNSPFVDEKTGVSARLSISAFENLVSTAERRMILNREKSTKTRITDFWGVIPAITGKVELVYEGEQEGPYQVALKFIFDAIAQEFYARFPMVKKQLKKNTKSEFDEIKQYFANGGTLELENDTSDSEFHKALYKVSGLEAQAAACYQKGEDITALMELILFGMTEAQLIGRNMLGNKQIFNDPLSELFLGMDEIDDED
jgi:magnesium chelatase subunit I